MDAPPIPTPAPAIGVVPASEPLQPPRRKWHQRAWVRGGLFGLIASAAGIIPNPVSAIVWLPALVLAKYFEIPYLFGGLILPIPLPLTWAVCAVFWAVVAEGFAFLFRHRRHLLVRTFTVLVIASVSLLVLSGVIARALAPYLPALCDVAVYGKDACFTRAALSRNDPSYCHRGEWAYWDEGYLPCLEPFLTAQTPPEFCDAIQKPKSGVFNACVERLARLHRNPSICERCTVDREQCAARVQQYIDGLSR